MRDCSAMRTRSRWGFLILLMATGALVMYGCGGGSGGDGGGRPPAPDETTYAVVDLGTLGGGTSVALDLNEAGHVVGNARLASNDAHAFLEASPLQDLGTLGGGGHSSATSINDNGVMVGWSWAPGTTTRHAFIYQSGTMTDLFPNDPAQALAINGLGHVVGVRNDHAFLWDGQAAIDLGTLGGNTSQARDINDDGLIVGWSKLADGTTDHAFVYAGGAMTDIGTLGGTSSLGYGVNDAGWVVGDSQTSAGGSDWSTGHGFLYRSGTMTDMGTLGGDKSHAEDVSDEGIVIGESMLADGQSWHAFLYFDGRMVDLNDLLDTGSQGWTLEQARGINGSRQIVGLGINPDGDRHAYLATPQ